MTLVIALNNFISDNSFSFSLLILLIIASPDFLIFFTSSSFFPKAIFNASWGSASIHNLGLDNVVEIIAELAKACTDDIIASALNRSGYKTGRNNRWTRERVTSFRSHRKIRRFTQQRKFEEGWMNLTEASAYLGI